MMLFYDTTNNNPFESLLHIQQANSESSLCGRDENAGLSITIDRRSDRSGVLLCVACLKVHNSETEHTNEEMTFHDIEQEISSYEKMHGYSSEQLLARQVVGDVPDTYEVQDWLTLLKYRKEATTKVTNKQIDDQKALCEIEKLETDKFLYRCEGKRFNFFNLSKRGYYYTLALDDVVAVPHVTPYQMIDIESIPTVAECRERMKALIDVLPDDEVVHEYLFMEDIWT